MTDRLQRSVAVAESFVRNNPAARRPAILFRLGIDTCQTCGTTGTYDCPDCGGWNTIEADHAPQHEHRHYYAYDIGVDLFVCACGATQQDRS